MHLGPSSFRCCPFVGGGYVVVELSFILLLLSLRWEFHVSSLFCCALLGVFSGFCSKFI